MQNRLTINFETVITELLYSVGVRYNHKTKEIIRPYWWPVIEHK